MAGIQSLNRTSESIARSQQIASETDAIGTDIIEDLSRQRDVLDRTKGRVSIVWTRLRKFSKQNSSFASYLYQPEIDLRNN